MISYNNILLQVHRQTLLKDASLKIKKRDHVVVRGASGTGKSSLLKIAVGAMPVSCGAVHVNGIELSAKTVADIRAQIAFIGQEPVLGTETIREALLLPFTFKTHRHNPPDDKRISQYLKRLHLEDGILDKPCKRISGGEKQRIAIIRALLLFADEITSALDPESRKAVMAELFRPEITLLSVSHDSEWIKGCTRIIEIKDQQLVEVLP
jgi:putative ABC transport system ATP-binding protein